MDGWKIIKFQQSSQTHRSGYQFLKNELIFIDILYMNVILILRTKQSQNKSQKILDERIKNAIKTYLMNYFYSPDIFEISNKVQK